MSVISRALSSRLIANSTKLGRKQCLSMSFLKLQKSVETSELHRTQNAHTFTHLPEEHQMLKETCRNFAEKELWPIAGEIDK